MADHVTDELTALLDGELADLERARVEEHLKACAACAAERDLLAAALGAVAAAAAIEPSPQLRRAVLNAIDAEPQGWRARFGSLLSVRFLVPAGVGAAAAAVLVAVMAVRATHLPPQLEDLEIARHLELLQDYDVVAMALPAGVDPEDADVVAHLDELEN